MLPSIPKFQLTRLPGSRNASFRFNPILFYLIFNFYFVRVGGSGDPNFSAHISSSWVKISLYTKFQLPRLPGSRIANFRLNPILGGG